MKKKHIDFLEKIVKNEGCCSENWNCEDCPFNTYMKKERSDDYYSCYEALIILPNADDDVTEYNTEDINLIYKNESIKILFNHYINESLTKKKKDNA